MENWLTLKEAHSPYIFSIPHSGLLLNSEAQENLLPAETLALPNMDWHLNALYDFVLIAPVSLISTAMSRYVVDLNRSPESDLFGDYRKSLVYDTNTWGDDIYRHFPTRAALKKRVEQYYMPYHDALDQLVQKALNAFGRCYIFDLHSFMVSIQCDICLGNRDGKSCSPKLMRSVGDALKRQGFRVAENKLFKGGYITTKYLDVENVESLQIELRYTNYIHHEHYESVQLPPIDSEKFASTQNKLRQVFRNLGII